MNNGHTPLLIARRLVLRIMQLLQEHGPTFEVPREEPSGKGIYNNSRPGESPCTYIVFITRKVGHKVINISHSPLSHDGRLSCLVGPTPRRCISASRRRATSPRSLGPSPCSLAGYPLHHEQAPVLCHEEVVATAVDDIEKVRWKRCRENGEKEKLDPVTAFILKGLYLLLCYCTTGRLHPSANSTPPREPNE